MEIFKFKMANYGTVIIRYKFVTSIRGNGTSFLTNLSSVGPKWRERMCKSWPVGCVQ